MDKLWNKLCNRETISYLIFGVLTTLVDWICFFVMSRMGIDYRPATVGAWMAAVAFAYVTNKIFVFRSQGFQIKLVITELVPFVTCRLGTGLLVLAMMIGMIEGLKISNELFCKVVTSGMSLVLNYIFSKWFIFKKNHVEE